MSTFSKHAAFYDCCYDRSDRVVEVINHGQQLSIYLNLQGDSCTSLELHLPYVGD